MTRISALAEAIGSTVPDATENGRPHQRGVATKGPTTPSTDLALLAPDPESKEMTVVSIHPGVSRAQVQDNTGWPVRDADKVAETLPPNASKLEVLRDLRARTQRVQEVA
jgi:glutaconate CoA-transferase subunit B